MQIIKYVKQSLQARKKKNTEIYGERNEVIISNTIANMYVIPRFERRILISASHFGAGKIKLFR